MKISVDAMKAELLKLSEKDPKAIDRLSAQLDDFRVALARKDPNEFVQYVLRDEETQEPIRQAPYHEALQNACTESKYAVIWGHVELGKALPLTEEIPTPDGFKTMGSLRPGDFVYAVDGSPTKVISKTKAHIPGKCYRVSFSDGSHLDASGDHQWVVWSSDRYAKGKPPKTMTTQEMLNAGLYVGDPTQTEKRYRAKYLVPVAQPVQGSEQELAVPPYALGAWLGRGTASCAEVTGVDRELLDRIEEVWPGDWKEVVLEVPGKQKTWRIRRNGSEDALRDLRLLDNKHIPLEYFCASVKQRLELLRGLMDTDGHVVRGDDKNTVELILADKRLAEDALTLVRSLGEKATLSENSTKSYDHHRYRIHWTVSGFNPFWLLRKASAIISRAKSKRFCTKAVVAITPIEPVPMACIGVAHPTHTYLAGRSYTVTHNCLTENALFWLPSGQPIKLQQLKERLESGETTRVLSINSKTLEQEWVKVKSVVYDSHAPCMRITTKTGLDTTTSFNHPFFIERGGERGWVSAAELKVGDVVFTADKIEPALGFEERPMSSALAFDLGVLFGLTCRNVRVPKLFGGTDELSINVSVEISRTNENTPDYLRVIREMSERFGWRVIYHDSFNELSLNRTTHVVIEGLRGWLEKLGIHFTRYWNGRQWIQEFYSDHGGFFPPFIYQADAAAIRSFMAGFLLNRFKFEEPNTGLREIGIFLPHIADAMMALSRRAGIRLRRNWGSFRAKIRVNKKYATISEQNIYTRLLARRVDIYPLMKEAHDRIRNRYTRLASDLEGYYIGVVDPDALGLEGKRRPLAERKPLTPVGKDVVVGIQPVGIQAVYATTIDSEDHTHVTDHILTHNTQQISIGRVLWEIGVNPSIRVCIVQATEGLAEDVVTTIKNYIEHSPEYHKVFPHVRRGTEWTAKSFTVERPSSIKDPTVLATGIHGNVLGRRFDLVIVDDGVTGDNSATDYMRDDTFNWLVTTPMSRLTRRARFWAIGNAWHIDDALHRFAKMAGFNSYKFPARDPVTGDPLWPERWSRQRMLDFAAARPPWEVARALDCKPRSSETGRFRYAWFERALERGTGLFGTDTMCWGLAQVPKGCQTFTGVDLGFSEAAGTDVTAITTLLATPEGRIQLLNIDLGNWDGLEIVERIARAHHRFKSYVYVESIIAQRWIIQNLRAKYPNIPVFPFQTRGTGTYRNKRHTLFGVESVATELAQDLWDIPRSSTGAIDPNIQRFIDGCMSYHPDNHTEDSLISSWIALQGARKQTGITGAVGLAEHSLYALVEEADDLSPEEKQERYALDRKLEKQKASEDWWQDLARELDLPKYSES